MSRSALSFLVVVALALASILPSPHATLWPDTVRDLAASLALARGEAFPLVGPSMNLGPHLGPAWLWLQAVPLWFVPSLAVASVYVAAVASLKYVFLFFLGRVLSGTKLGLCIAVAAAFPSIAVHQWAVFFHPNWVETAIAATLLLAGLAAKRRSIGLFYAACALQGLSIQLHPTALFYFPVLLLALAHIGVRGWRLVGHLLGGVLLMGAWFAPLLLVPGLEEQAGAQAVSARIEGALRAFAPLDTVTVLKHAYWDTPLAVGDTYISRVGIPAWVWGASLAIAAAGMVLGAIACLRDSGWRRWAFLAALLALLAGWIVVVAIRAATPFYLCYFLLPLSAIVLGAGLDRASSSPHAVFRVTGWGAIVAIALLAVVAAVGARRMGKEAYFESRLPVLAELRQTTQDKIRATLVSASSRDLLARHVCGQREAVTLHGEFAYTLAASANLDLHLHCPERKAETFVLGPSEGRVALTGLAALHADLLGKSPFARFRGLAAFPVARAIHPPQGRAIEPDWYYFELLRDRQPMGRVSLRFTTQPGEAVGVFRLKPFASRWENYSVAFDGRPASAVASTYNSDLYASPAAGEWVVEFETDAPQWVDVHVF